MPTSVEICNVALVSIGAGTITSLQQAVTEAVAANQFYETTVRNWLSLYRWRFASGQQQLSRLQAAPVHRFSAAYQLPAATISLHGIFVNDLPIDYQKYLDKAYCDAESTDLVYADITTRVDEAYFPAYFVTLLEFSLASRLATTLAAKLDLSDKFEKMAQMQFTYAKTADAQQNTARRIPLGRFKAVRY